MSVPQQNYQDSEAYQKYLNNGLRPTELLKPITVRMARISHAVPLLNLYQEDPVHLAPGEVFCRWMDSEYDVMCYRVGHESRLCTGVWLIMFF